MLLRLIDVYGLRRAYGEPIARLGRVLCRSFVDEPGGNVVFAAAHDDVDLVRAWLDREVVVLPYSPSDELTPTLRDLRPSVAISPLGPAGPCTARGLDAPHVLVIGDVLELERPDMDDEGRRLLETAQAATSIVTFLPHTKDRLLHHAPLDRVVVIPPVLYTLPDPPPFRPVSPPYVIHPMTGREHPKLLDEVMTAAWRRRPDLKLVVVGAAGGELSSLREHGTVYDMRAASEDELAATYAAAECTISVAEHEDSGLAVLEAMANGCPVLCRSGAPSVSLIGEAALTLPDDPEAWAQAIIGPRRDELIGRALVDAGSEEAMIDAWRAEIERASGPPSTTADPDELKRVAAELVIWSRSVTRLEERLEPMREIEERIEANRREAAANQPDRPLPLGIGVLRRALRLHWRRAHRIGRLRVFDPLRPKLGWTHQHEPRTMRVRVDRSSPPSPAPSIAIATPSFNQAVYLERTIRSVLDQGYPNLQFVVQDGGSTDGSVEVIERYREHLHHAESRPDEGQAHAINLGLAKTNAEIMAYLNSDDLLLPGTLNTVARYLVTHPEVDAVYGHRVLIDEDDLEVGRWVMPPHADDVLLAADYIPQETLFWRRSLWEAIGGAVNEERRFAMDWDLLLRFRDTGARIVRLPRFLGAFRVHAEQKTTASIDVGHEEMDLLRRRYGGPTEWPTIQSHMRSYVRKHVLLHALYRMRLLRY